ncbi:YchJ family metal-binding protein [Rhizobium sp. S152]|uniref:YchJ family protein n=1 Tax=Rhizobium sp. S152 TaxID=3055038 RepID=UPI0025AA02E3|nr:YchJ family metal-binding protein [Rhizobium sp. S152]MDM9624988.1 YchJ family metal-binding protein [Rhizobium sp. S152]
MASCPCCSTRDFDDCCGPFVAGKPVPSAEALMRSRYTATTLADLDYLEKTCTENALMSFNRIDMERSLPDAEWVGMEVRRTDRGTEADEDGTVEFAFRYRYRGRDFTQVERANCVRQDGTWLFDDSEVNPTPPPVRVLQIGRNDPCPCGSGQKYKKCCHGQDRA